VTDIANYMRTLHDYIDMTHHAGVIMIQCALTTRWAWTEAGAQSHVEEALSIGGFGYPVSSFRLVICLWRHCSGVA